MINIIFQHLRSTKNVGDRWCCPIDYFDFPGAKVGDLSKPSSAKSIIVGGGAIGRSRSSRATNLIAWGVGISIKGKTATPPAPAGYGLYGSREYGQLGAEYVPCVSCMSDLFNRRYEIRHEVAFYGNGDPSVVRRRPRTIKGLPSFTNRGTLEECIAFLGSAETIITDSYHGVYWATLLGRKVICLPYSSKFYGFKFKPALTSDDWRSAEPKSYPEALADSRARNLWFRDIVMDKIYGRQSVSEGLL